MQTTTLPIQVSGAGPANAPQRSNGAGEAGQFGATLAREMRQRSPQQAANQQPSASANQQAQTGHGPDEASAPDAATAPATAQASAAADSGKAQQTEDSDAAGDEAQQADGASASPAADLLTLMATFNQLHKAASPTVAAGAQKGLAQASEDHAPAALSAGTKRVAGLDLTTRAQALVHAQAGASAQPDDDGVATPAGGASAAAAGPALAAATGADAGARAKALPAADFGAQVRDIAAKLATVAPAAAPAPQLQAVVAEAARPLAAGADQLTARVGSTAWENQVSQKVVWMVGSEEQTASLTLNPPDLGPLQVVLSVSGDQASVAFSASHEEVRHALEDALPRLREMMSESGIALGNATVGTGMPDQRQAQADSGGGNAGRAGLASASGAEESAPAVATRTTILGDRAVDTFA